MVEPLVCEPIASGTMPAATAAAEPLEEPPGVRVAIVRIAGLAGAEQRHFGGHGLAHDHRAGLAQQRDRGAVAVRPAAGVQHGAVLGRHVGGVEDVLDADRNAVQRPHRLAVGAGFVERARLAAGVLRIEKGPGLDVAVDLLDAGEAGFRYLLGGNGAVTQRGDRGGERRRFFGHSVSPRISGASQAARIRPGGGSATAGNRAAPRHRE